jgi:hypothetical protein
MANNQNNNNAVSPKVNYDSVASEQLEARFFEENYRPTKNLQNMTEEEKIKGVKVGYMASYLATVSIGMFQFGKYYFLRYEFQATLMLLGM